VRSPRPRPGGCNYYGPCEVRPRREAVRVRWLIQSVPAGQWKTDETPGRPSYDCVQSRVLTVKKSARYAQNGQTRTKAFGHYRCNSGRHEPSRRVHTWMRFIRFRYYSRKQAHGTDYSALRTANFAFMAPHRRRAKKTCSNDSCFILLSPTQNIGESARNALQR